MHVDQPTNTGRHVGCVRSERQLRSKIRATRPLAAHPSAVLVREERIVAPLGAANLKPTESGSQGHTMLQRSPSGLIACSPARRSRPCARLCCGAPGCNMALSLGFPTLQHTAASAQRHTPACTAHADAREPKASTSRSQAGRLRTTCACARACVCAQFNRARARVCVWVRACTRSCASVCMCARASTCECGAGTARPLQIAAALTLKEMSRSATNRVRPAVTQRVKTSQLFAAVACPSGRM